jgi:flagellar hook assembly protein FlgD
VHDFKPAGTHEFTWDGRDAAGVRVSSGMYFYQLQSEDLKLTKKMLMIK